MTITLDDIFKRMTLYTDDEPYVLLKLPPNAITVAAGIIAEVGDPFSVLIVDKDEVTLVVHKDVPDEFGKRLRDATISETEFRLITFDIELSFDVVGFMHAVAGILAEENISILPFGAYSRDHILVNASDFEKAKVLLGKRIAS